MTFHQNWAMANTLKSGKREVYMRLKVGVSKKLNATQKRVTMKHADLLGEVYI